jgi:hypothetical protein
MTNDNEKQEKTFLVLWDSTFKRHWGGTEGENMFALYFSFLLILSLSTPTPRMVEPKTLNDNTPENRMFL